MGSMLWVTMNMRGEANDSSNRRTNKRRRESSVDEYHVLVAIAGPVRIITTRHYLSYRDQCCV